MRLQSLVADSCQGIIDVIWPVRGGLVHNVFPLTRLTSSTPVLTAKSLTTSISITGLTPLSTYEFRVCAYNELGASAFTEPLVLTTEMEGTSLSLSLPFLLQAAESFSSAPPLGLPTFPTALMSAT